MIPIAEEMDSCGFHAMEVVGGATSIPCTDFWRGSMDASEDFEKVYYQNTFRDADTRTKSCRYRHYADDVVRAFVDKACEIGIDVFPVVLTR